MLDDTRLVVTPTHEALVEHLRWQIKSNEREARIWRDKLVELQQRAGKYREALERVVGLIRGGGDMTLVLVEAADALGLSAESLAPAHAMTERSVIWALLEQDRLNLLDLAAGDQP